TFNKFPGIKNDYRIITVNRDRVNTEYISTMEGEEYSSHNIRSKVNGLHQYCRHNIRSKVNGLHQYSSHNIRSKVNKLHQYSSHDIRSKVNGLHQYSRHNIRSKVNKLHQYSIHNIRSKVNGLHQYSSHNIRSKALPQLALAGSKDVEQLLKEMQDGDQEIIGITEQLVSEQAPESTDGTAFSRTYQTPQAMDEQKRVEQTLKELTKWLNDTHSLINTKSEETLNMDHIPTQLQEIKVTLLEHKGLASE
ncbi:predicted protein, partial [Nematostella vectensis]